MSEKNKFEIKSSRSGDENKNEELGQGVNYPEKNASLLEEMKEKITPFIKEKIESGDLHFSFGNHGHLNYEDDKYWGHYFSAEKGGLAVTVYEQSQIKGDPMDIEGERGQAVRIFIPLESDYIKMLIDSVGKQLENAKADLNKEMAGERNASALSSIKDHIFELSEIAYTLNPAYGRGWEPSNRF